MDKRILTCIVCPRGCTLTVALGEDGAPVSVEGNLCKRGESYAIDECTSPMRTVTSTVRTESGRLIAVKTERAVPKALVFSVMERINTTLASDEADIGDVIIENVCDTGVNIIATSRKV